MRPTSAGLYFHCAAGLIQDPLTRAHVRLLGPCFKTGRVGDRSTRRKPSVTPASHASANRDAAACGHELASCDHTAHELLRRLSTRHARRRRRSPAGPLYCHGRRTGRPARWLTTGDTQMHAAGHLPALALKTVHQPVAASFGWETNASVCRATLAEPAPSREP